MLLTFASCDNPRIHGKENQEMPKALEKKSSFDIASKRRYDDIVASLYNEQVEKRPELKELEIKLENLSMSKEDSTNSFSVYNSTNQSYYNSANNHIDQIKDSVLRKKMQAIISASLTRYNKRISRHTALLKSIDIKELSLYDLHEILVLTTTLPLMERFQKESLPTTKSIEGYSIQLDKVLNSEKVLVQKNK